jgi:hypothetical protein
MWSYNWINNPKNETVLCIGLSSSNGKVIPFCRCGQLDKCGWCLTQINIRALWNMFKRIWAILGFTKLIDYSKHSINGEGYNYKFNSLCLGVWCVTKCKHYSMHLHFIYNHFPSGGLDIGGVWILLIPLIWPSNITSMFWLWLRLFEVVKVGAIVGL